MISETIPLQALEFVNHMAITVYADYMSIIWQVPSLTSISFNGACEFTTVTKEDEIRNICMQ
jgi:hypothetical protein